MNTENKENDKILNNKSLKVFRVQTYWEHGWLLTIPLGCLV